MRGRRFSLRVEEEEEEEEVRRFKQQQ